MRSKRPTTKNSTWQKKFHFLGGTEFGQVKLFGAMSTFGPQDISNPFPSTARRTECEYDHKFGSEISNFLGPKKSETFSAMSSFRSLGVLNAFSSTVRRAECEYDHKFGSEISEFFASPAHQKKILKLFWPRRIFGRWAF